MRMKNGGELKEDELELEQKQKVNNSEGEMKV